MLPHNQDCFFLRCGCSAMKQLYKEQFNVIDQVGPSKQFALQKGGSTWKQAEIEVTWK